MRISQLRCFVTIAQLENMSQAAELLHLSQSSLSKNIAGLEEELGMPLFHRNGRRLTLNPAGERLLEYSTMALRELEYAMQDMRLLADGTESRIRIGIAGSGAMLMECLAAFRRQVPEVEFDLTGNIENQTQLDINNYDMLIYPDIHKYEKFIGMPLYEEKYCLAVPVNHPLADRPVIRAKMLEGEDIVFLRSGRSGEEFPFQICSALAIRFSSVCYADTRDLHRQMIADGLCVGFVPAGLSGFYKDDAVTLIPVSDQRFTRRMMICFRREKHLTSRVKEFRDFVLSWFNIGENG